MIFSHKTPLLFFALLMLTLNSCHLFQSTKVSTIEINKASEWSSKDQPPTFQACEILEGAEARACFDSIVSNSITDFIYSNPLESKALVDDEIRLLIQIDKAGNFSLISTVLSNSTAAAMPALESLMEQAVSNLPQAIPAIKTNVGELVSTQVELPIRIIAQAQN